ncbi:MAG: DUF697 domain-containing protein [Lentisphaerae bacterium]|nr:DUF697 domain-containing protein [Lentisphaerota bacterium]
MTHTRRWPPGKTQTRLPGSQADNPPTCAPVHTTKGKKSMKPNILVCGKTGVGKTSLIQAMTHAGTVPDDAIGDSRPTTEGFDLYQTEIVNFIDCEGMEPGKIHATPDGTTSSDQNPIESYLNLLMSEVVRRLDSNDAEQCVHLVWYCLSGSDARVQPADARMIEAFRDRVLVVVTKVDLMRRNQLEAFQKALFDLVSPDQIVMISSLQKNGLDQLLSKTLAMTEQAIARAGQEVSEFNERWRKYYVNMRDAWQRRTESEAASIIQWAAGRAAAIAAVPLPLADVGPLVANEIYMIHKLGNVYGYAVNETIITMLLGCIGGSVAGKFAASFLPFLKIPIAAGITYGVGKAAKAYFESDMTLDANALKKKFLEGEKEAKSQNWKKTISSDSQEEEKEE